jgi:TPR repeat protein
MKIRSISLVFGLLLMIAQSALAQVSIRVKSDYESGVQMHENGNIKMAIVFFEQGAQKGDAKSEFALATYYHFGEGVPKDYEKARKLFESAAAKDNAESLTMLGLIYRQGQGASKDATKAAVYFTKAALSCVVQAQEQLSNMLFYGDGINPQKTEALAWLYIAAKSSSPSAMTGVQIVEKEVTPTEKTEAQTKMKVLEQQMRCPK